MLLRQNDFLPQMREMSSDTNTRVTNWDLSLWIDFLTKIIFFFAEILRSPKSSSKFRDKSERIRNIFSNNNLKYLNMDQSEFSQSSDSNEKRYSIKDLPKKPQRPSNFSSIGYETDLVSLFIDL